MNNILITGVSGNVGSAVLKYLKGEEACVHIGVRNISKYQDVDSDLKVRELDFEKKSTYVKALENIDKVFIIRPPQITDVEGVFEPFVNVCKQEGVSHIVFLSLIGIEKNTRPPHHKIEKVIEASGIAYTFIRPSFFMQNLIEPHGDDIRKLNKIIIPAGKAKTNFVDTDDIGEIVSRVLVGDEHLNKAYDITGSESIDYYQVADSMTEILGRKILYTKPSLLRFYLHMRKKNHPRMKVVVMIYLYLSTRFGMAEVYSDEAEKLLGRKPKTIDVFIENNKGIWLK